MSKMIDDGMCDAEFVSPLAQTEIKASSFTRNASRSTTVAPSMAKDGYHPVPGGKDVGSCADPSHPPTNSTSKLALLPGLPLHGGIDKAARSSLCTMPTRAHPEVWQQTRPLQQVHRLPEEVGVERKHPNLGRSTLKKAAGAAAFAIAFNCHQLPRQDVYPSSPHGHCGTSEVYSSRYPVIAELSIGPTKDFAFTDQGQEATQLTGEGAGSAPDPLGRQPELGEEVVSP